MMSAEYSMTDLTRGGNKGISLRQQKDLGFYETLTKPSGRQQGNKIRQRRMRP